MKNTSRWLQKIVVEMQQLTHREIASYKKCKIDNCFLSINTIAKQISMKQTANIETIIALFRT